MIASWIEVLGSFPEFSSEERAWCVETGKKIQSDRRYSRPWKHANVVSYDLSEADNIRNVACQFGLCKLRGDDLEVVKKLISLPLSRLPDENKAALSPFKCYAPRDFTEEITLRIPENLPANIISILCRFNLTEWVGEMWRWQDGEEAKERNLGVWRSWGGSHARCLEPYECYPYANEHGLLLPLYLPLDHIGLVR